MSNQKNKKPIYKRWWFILLGLVIVYGLVTDITRESKNENKEDELTFEYEIIESEETNLGDFKKVTLNAITSEMLNKNQIETLLNKIEKDIKYDKEKDQVYIFLYEKELLVDEGYTYDGYSLGKLLHKDNETKIDAREKDWNKKPTEKEYELYVRFMEKTQELTLDLTSDEEMAKAVAKEENVESDFVLKSVEKVGAFTIMDSQ